MKKIYVTPQTEAIEMEILSVVADSGPGFNDSPTAPNITDDGDDGPGGGDYGDTPSLSNSNLDVWED